MRKLLNRVSTTDDLEKNGWKAGVDILVILIGDDCQAVAGRTIRQTRHLPGAPGPIEGFWGPQNAPMHIFCPHIYYFYKNLFTIVASGCLITHVLTIFPCAPPFSLHYMDYSMLRASRSSRVCRNDVKFKTVSGKRERERNRVRHKSSET